MDHVTQIDCGILCAEHGLTGWTWIVDAQIVGQCDRSGMLVDFGPAKRLIKDQVESLVDHRLLIPSAAPGLDHTGAEWTWTTDRNGRITYAGPPDSVAMIEAASITTSHLQDWLASRVHSILPESVDSVRLQLRDESATDDGATYNYCHGLPAHDGDCQQLGHGHRASLEIFVDGHCEPDYARDWAQHWQHVIIASSAYARADGEYVTLEYRAARGRFRLCIKRDCCVLLAGPPTVENISAYIADTLSHREPRRRFRVRATEGVGKGAVIERGPN